MYYSLIIIILINQIIFHIVILKDLIISRVLHENDVKFNNTTIIVSLLMLFILKYIDSYAVNLYNIRKALDTNTLDGYFVFCFFILYILVLILFLFINPKFLTDYVSFLKRILHL